MDPPIVFCLCLMNIYIMLVPHVKANVVADAFSCRSHVSQLVVDSMPFELCEEFDKLNLRIIANMEATEMEVGSNLLQESRKG
jgi:hypothetical protein